MPWIQVNLHDGTTVQLYMQQFANECGPSCVATIGRIFLGTGLDIGAARTTVGAVDHNRPPGGGMGHDWQRERSQTAYTKTANYAGESVVWFPRSVLQDISWGSQCHVPS